jgi:hypothetical protein
MLPLQLFRPTESFIPTIKQKRTAWVRELFLVLQLPPAYNVVVGFHSILVRLVIPPAHFSDKPPIKSPISLCIVSPPVSNMTETFVSGRQHITQSWS